MQYYKIWGQEFIDALNNGNWSEVIRIKNESIPKRIHKFFSLYDEDMVDYRRRNNDKLESLEKEKIWSSETKLLNDPFELKSMTPDKQRLIRYGWDVELV